MKKLLLMTLMLALCLPVTAVHATSANLSFTKLSGVTGGAPAETAVYRADLSGLGLATVESLSIQDSNSGIGGSPGKFSGFDLDALKLSNSLVNDASLVNGLAGLAVFDFSPLKTFFFPGTERPPVDSGNLFGSSGGNLDNSVATLGSFDGNSTTDASAFGFISLGDGGKISFNLTTPVSTAGLFLYIGEVGDNGEVAAGTITASDVAVPIPATSYLLGAGLLCLVGFRTRLGI